MSQLDYSSRDVVNVLLPAADDARRLYDRYEFEDFVVGRGGLLIGPMSTMKAGKEHGNSKNLFEKFTLVPVTPTEERKTPGFSTATTISSSRTTPSVSSNSSSSSSYSRKANSDGGGGKRSSFTAKFTTGGGGMRKKSHAPNYKFFKKNLTPESTSNGREERAFFKHRHPDAHHKRKDESDNRHTGVSVEAPYHQGHTNNSVLTSVYNSSELSNHPSSHRASNKTTSDHRHTSTTQTHQKPLSSSTANSSSCSNVRRNSDTRSDDYQVQHKHSNPRNSEKAPTRPNMNNSSPDLSMNNYSRKSTIAVHVDTDSESSGNCRAKDVENTNLSTTFPANNERHVISPPVFSPISDAESNDEDKPSKKTTNSSMFNDSDDIIVDVVNENNWSEIENNDCDLGEEKTSTSTFMPKIVDVVSLSTESSIQASNTSTSWPQLYNSLSEPTVINCNTSSAKPRQEEEESPAREKVVFKIKPLKTKVFSKKNRTLEDSSRDSFVSTDFSTLETSEAQNGLANDKSSPLDNSPQEHTIAVSNIVGKAISKSLTNKQIDETIRRKSKTSKKRSVTSLNNSKAKKRSVRSTKRNLGRTQASEAQQSSSSTVVTVGRPSIKKRKGRKFKKAQNDLLNNKTVSYVSDSRVKTAEKTTRRQRITMKATVKQSIPTGSPSANLAGQKGGVESRNVEMTVSATCQSASQDMAAQSSPSTGMMTSVVSNGCSKEQQDTQILISLFHSQLNEMAKLRQHIQESNEKQTQLFERLSSMEHVINLRLKATPSVQRFGPEQQTVPPQSTGVSEGSAVNSGGVSPTRKRSASPVVTGDKALQDSTPKTKKHKRRDKKEPINSTALISEKNTGNESFVSSTNLPSAVFSVSVQNPQTSVDDSSTIKSLLQQGSVTMATSSHVTQHVASTSNATSPTTIVSVGNYQSEASRQEEISRAVMSITRSPLSTEECVTNLSPIVATVEDNSEKVEQLPHSTIGQLRKAERSKSMSPLPAIQRFKHRHSKRATTLPPDPPVFDYSKSSSPPGNSGENLTSIAQPTSKAAETSPLRTALAKSIAFSPAATAKVAEAATAAAEATKPHAVVAIHPLLTPLIISENEKLSQSNVEERSTSGSPNRFVIVTSPDTAAPSASTLSSGGQLNSQKSHESVYSKQSDDNTERITTAPVRKPSSRGSSLANDQVNAGAALNNSNAMNQQTLHPKSASHAHHRLSAADTEYHLHQMQEQHLNHHRQPVLHYQPPYSQAMSGGRMSETIMFPFRGPFQPSMQYHQAHYGPDVVRTKAVPRQMMHGEANNQLPPFLPSHQYVVEPPRHQQDHPHHHQPMPKPTGHIQAVLQQPRVQHHTDQQQSAQWHNRQQHSHQEAAGIDDISMSSGRSADGEGVAPVAQQLSPNVRYVMAGDNSNNRPSYSSNCQQPNCQKCEAQLPQPQLRYQYAAQARADDMASMRFGSSQVSPPNHRPPQPLFGMFARPQVRHVNQPLPHHQKSKQVPHHGFAPPNSNIRQMYSGPMQPPYQAVPPFMHGGGAAGMPIAADVTGDDVVYVGTDRIVPIDANGRPGQDSTGYPTGHHRQTFPSQQQQQPPQTHHMPMPATCDHYLPHPPKTYKPTETTGQPHTGPQGHARVGTSAQQPSTTSREPNNAAPTSSANAGTLLKPCDQCKKPAHLLCSGCRLGHYCSTTCQAAAWSGGHNKVCRWTEQPATSQQQ